MAGLTFSSADRNSSGGYSYSSAVSRRDSGSSSSAPAYSGPGSSTFNSYYSPNGGYEQNLNSVSGGSGYDGNGSSYVPAPTYDGADGKTYDTAAAAEAATREWNLEQAADQKATDDRRDERFGTSDRKGLLDTAPKQKSNLANPAGAWEAPDEYLAVDWDQQILDAEKRGASQEEIDALDYQRGWQSGYQRQRDNDRASSHFTDFAKDHGNEALASAGNIYKDVKERNAPMHEDAIAEGYTAQDRANFAFDDTFAAEENTGADFAAGLLNVLPIPFLGSIAQGVVDAKQASDARLDLLGEELSLSDKFRVGLNSATGVRSINGLLGNEVGMYDNYGATIIPEDTGSDPYIKPILDQPVGQDVADATKDPNALNRNNYGTHIKKFGGGRAMNAWS